MHNRRVALVTGASRGIGRATALRLAEDGYDVAVIYAGDDAAAAQVVRELEARGATAAAFRCNVADAAAVKECVAQVEAQLGPVWALVNNAGITRDGLLMRMSDEDFDRVMDVNVKGAFNMVRACARGFVRQRGGRIVNMGSVVGLMGNAGQANYAASKAALVGLTKAVARELAPRGVTCNLVAPGFVRTSMTDALPEPVRQKYHAQIPLGRMAEPEEVAALVAFLARDEAAYVTGTVVRVDGGMDM